MAPRRWIPETLFDDLGFRMTYEVERVIQEVQTEHQQLVLFEHAFFGKMLMLDGAIEKLAAESPPKAALVKLRYFAGLSHQEAADALGISRATADRYWAYARAFLYAEMQDAERS